MLQHDSLALPAATKLSAATVGLTPPAGPGLLIGTTLHHQPQAVPQLVLHGDPHFHSFDQYTERVVLQEGRHSVVVSAWHTNTAQPVVIKAYTKASLKPRQHANVLREVRLLLQLNSCRCPGIVAMLAAFEDDAKLYLVFKACMRGDLYQLLMKEPSRKLDEHLVASAVTLPLVLTLAELHSKDIVHRDIKPENVFIDLDGHVQLGDFGLAAQHTDNLTERVGTLDYMAPEVLAMPTPSEIAAGRGVPQHPYNEKVDVWAVGCLCYELLSGSPPFEVQDPKETAKLIMVGKPAPFPSSLSASGSDFIRQALAHKPSQRPSALQLLEHPWLKQHQQHQHRPHQHHTEAYGNGHGEHASGPHHTGGGGHSDHSGAAYKGTHPHVEVPSHHHQPESPYEAWGLSGLNLLHIHEQQQIQQIYKQQQHQQQQGTGSRSPTPSGSPTGASPTSHNHRTSSEPMAHAYPTATSPTGRNSLDNNSVPIAGLHICTTVHLPPGLELSEASSTEDDSGGLQGSSKSVLRPSHNRRASSGTSEYLTYNTPRCGSPEHMTRSVSATTPGSPFANGCPAGVLSPPSSGAGLRASSSCNGSVDAGTPEPEPPQPLTWQSSAGACKKAVGKSRFAR